MFSKLHFFTACLALSILHYSAVLPRLKELFTQVVGRLYLRFICWQLC